MYVKKLTTGVDRDKRYLRMILLKLTFMLHVASTAIPLETIPINIPFWVSGPPLSPWGFQFKRCSNWTSLYIQVWEGKTGHFLRKDYLQNTLLFHILLHKAVCCCLSWNQINVHIFQTQQGPPKILINKLWSHWNDLNKIIIQC